MIGKAAKPLCLRVNPSTIPYNNQPIAWYDRKLTKWWFHDAFLPEIRKQISRQVVLLADNFGSPDIDNLALQDPQVQWILLPPNCTAVHQPMDQGIIAILKATCTCRYKSKLIHIMIRNLDNFDQLRQLGSALAAGVRGLDRAYPPNLPDVASLVHQAWDSLSQATLANCWLKDDILPHFILLTFVKTLEDTIISATLANCWLKDDILPHFILLTFVKTLEDTIISAHHQLFKISAL